MQPSNNAPLAHTIPEACRRLSIGKTTLYQLMTTGDIKAIKVGTRTLIPETELQRFIESRLAGDMKAAA